MIKVELCKVKDGMILAEPVFCPQTGKMLLKDGTTMTTALINSIKTRGVKHICISEEFTLQIDPYKIITQELRQLVDQEIIRLAPEKIEANTSDKMAEVSRLSRRIAAKILQKDDLLQFCVEMKIMDSEFLYKHSITTCALALLVSGAMGLSENEMFVIGKGALLHDLGLREMPLVMKVVKRNNHEESLWKEHPTYGYYFGKEYGLEDEVLRIIMCHHENWNGSGFPKGLSGTQIPLSARIVAVCETYDRLLRHEKFLHYQAIEYLYGGGNYFFDSQVAQAFTNNLAVYPLGSLVRLSTGEVGIVVNVRKNLGPRPIVRIYYNRVNRPLAYPKDIDLGEERTIFIEQVL